MKPVFTRLALAFAALIVFFIISQVNYLLFHSLVEIFSIIVAYSIFIIAWNSRHLAKNNYLIFLGIAYLSVGTIDIFHLLAYKNMGVFPYNSSNLATQLWIGGRFVESISFLIAPFFNKGSLKLNSIFIMYLTVTVIITSSIFVFKVFPVCYIEETGLTAFKIYSEYAIILILLLALKTFSSIKFQFNENIYRLIAWAIAASIFAELSFTLYIDVFGILNMIGHLFELVSFYLLYDALIATGIKNPYKLLFRELVKSKEDIIDKNEELEKAMDKVKLLSGLIPICSNCKNIRDDKGYWGQIEVYIRDHSEAEFTHGLCPDCSKKLYPDIHDKLNLEK